MRFRSFDKLVYVKSEILHREFEGHLLLSIFLANKGYRVIVGRSRDVHQVALAFRRGISIEKDAADTSPAVGELFRAGVHCVLLESEGVFRTYEGFLRTRQIRLGTNYTRLKAIFAWGKFQQGLYLQLPLTPSPPVYVTGSPRTDLGREPFRGLFSSEVRIRQENLGDFILVSTSFPPANLAKHYGMSYLELVSQQGLTRDPSDREYFEKFEPYIGKIFHEYGLLVRGLASRYRDTKIVVRPHPSENPETWREYTSDLPNVLVESEGHILGWILGASVLIQSGSTVGLEARAISRPVISFNPFFCEGFEPFTLNHSEPVFRSINQVFEAIDELRAKGPVAFERFWFGKNLRVKDYLESVDGPFASEQISEIVAQLDSDDKFLTSQLREVIGLLKMRLILILRHLLSLLLLFRVVPARWDRTGRLSGTSPKFQKISLGEVRRKVKALETCGSSLGLATVEVKQIAQSAFEIRLKRERKHISRKACHK